MTRQKKTRMKVDCSRREFLLGALGAGIAASGSSLLLGSCTRKDWRAGSFIAKGSQYEAGIALGLLGGVRGSGGGGCACGGPHFVRGPELRTGVCGGKPWPPHAACIPDITGDFEARELGGIRGQAENAPLDRSDPLHEEPLRIDAGNLLRMAQEHPPLGR